MTKQALELLEEGFDGFFDIPIRRRNCVQVLSNHHKDLQLHVDDSNCVLGALQFAVGLVQLILEVLDAILELLGQGSITIHGPLVLSLVSRFTSLARWFVPLRVRRRVSLVSVMRPRKSFTGRRAFHLSCLGNLGLKTKIPVPLNSAPIPSINSPQEERGSPPRGRPGAPQPEGEASMARSAPGLDPPDPDDLATTPTV